MADILYFAKGGPHRGRSPREPAGEIVIFPGIRVEYHDRQPAPSRKRRTKGAKRRRSKDAVSA
jgi:hypothetical protein